MAYTDLTSSIVRASGDIISLISGSIPKIISTRNTSFATSVFSQRQSSISTRSLGNYKFPYEYISLFGRTENNLSNRDYPVTQSLPQIPFFQGKSIYTLATRSQNDSVVAIKFSAPGGPEVQSRGFLDREAEELSVYNALPFRNYSIRTESNKDYRQHMDLSSVASYTKHKTPRNTRYSVMQEGSGVSPSTASVSTRYITSSNFDNGNINYHLPYHHDQIQWAYRVFAKSSSSWAERFAADPNMTGTAYYYTASVVNSGSLTASFTNDYSPAYGFPTWIQIRAGESWKNRILKNNNFIIRYQPDVSYDNSGVINQPIYLIGTGSLDASSEGSYLFKESPIDYTNESIEYIIPRSNRPPLIFKENMFHNIFFNDELNNLYELSDTVENRILIKFENYNRTYNKRYKKQIFPHPKHAGLKRSKIRESFNFDAWRDDDYKVYNNYEYHFNINNSRQVTGSVPGYTVPNLYAFNLTGSIWPLDFYGHPSMPNTGSHFVAGELMLLGAVQVQHLDAIAKRQFLPLASYVLAPTAFFSDPPGGSYIPWSAFSQAQSVPFLDTNEKFSQLTKRAYKNYSYIPEFNISSQISDTNFTNLSDIILTQSLQLYCTGSTIDTQLTDIFNVKQSLQFKIDSILQIRPYKNFYPCQFTLEMAKVFSSSLNNTSIDQYTHKFEAMKPFFIPGVLFNSIKAGLPMSLVNPSATFESIFDPGQYLQGKYFSSSQHGTLNFTETLGFNQFQNAVNNFLKEVRFTFCKNSSLNYFESKYDNEFNIFESGTKYSMDIQVTLGNIETTASTGNSLLPSNSIIGGVNYLYANLLDSNIPPWWNILDIGLGESANSVIRIEFTPSYTRKYTLDEIFALSTKEIRQSNLVELNYTTPSITGSFNCFEQEIDKDGNKKWKIKSKWEFPFLCLTGAIMYFRDNTELDNAAYPKRPDAEPSLSLLGGQYFGGLWHDFCDIPSENQGLFLQLSDVNIFNGSVNIKSASLADQVGFLPIKKRVSELKDQTEISELICIVPIKKSDNSLFTIDETYEIYKNNGNLANKYFLPSILGYTSKRQQTSKLFFGVEIEDVWSKKDLAYIWQNLLPQNGLKHSEKQNIYTVTDQKVLNLLKNEDVYFSIFKCKLRSVSNPWPNYGYNWPWDYFSLIELCKIDIITEETFNK